MLNVDAAEHGSAIVEEFNATSAQGRMDVALDESRTCSAPTRIQGTLLFKGESLREADQRFFFFLFAWFFTTHFTGFNRLTEV